MSLGSRRLNQFQYTMEKDSVTLFGSFTVDGYGEVSQFQGGGVASVEAVDATTGQFEITLEDGWDYLFEVSTQIVRETASAVAVGQLLMDPADLTTAIKTKQPLVVQFLNYAGSAADPEDDALVRFKIVVRRSSVQYFDTMQDA